MNPTFCLLLVVKWSGGPFQPLLKEQVKLEYYSQLTP